MDENLSKDLILIASIIFGLPLLLIGGLIMFEVLRIAFEIIDGVALHFIKKIHEKFPPLEQRERPPRPTRPPSTPPQMSAYSKPNKE